MRPSDAKGFAMNLVVLRGRVSSAPSVRRLASGAVVASFELATEAGSGERVDVPVTSAVAEGVEPCGCGDEVVVLGVVRRRFFRVGGVTQSRTEVLASEIIPGRQRRRVRMALRRCAEQLGDEQAGAVRSVRDSGQRRSPR